MAQNARRTVEIRITQREILDKKKPVSKTGKDYTQQFGVYMLQGKACIYQWVEIRTVNNTRFLKVFSL